MKAVVDTNILDFRARRPEAAAERARFADRAVTWAEVLVGTSPDDEVETRASLDLFTVLDVTRNIADASVRLRRSHRIRLPDAIIWATATIHDALLATRNTKDFPADDPAIRISYRH